MMVMMMMMDNDDNNDDEHDLKCRLLAVGPNAISSQLRRLLDVAAQMDNNLVVREKMMVMM